LLDQTALIQSAADHARKLGFEVTFADDLVEQPVDVGAAELMRRFAQLHQSADEGKRICLVSAGEFRCPVRGGGRGGRNAETVLRALLANDELTRRNEAATNRIAVLSAGTDGIDGNSPAAGAIGDETTLHRARERGLDAEDFLRRSDSYTFFSHLDDAIMTGATGTNVRDLRLVLA
jgi:hydroxypyruvate reductase